MYGSTFEGNTESRNDPPFEIAGSPCVRIVVASTETKKARQGAKQKCKQKAKMDTH